MPSSNPPLAVADERGSRRDPWVRLRRRLGVVVRDVARRGSGGSR